MRKFFRLFIVLIEKDFKEYFLRYPISLLSSVIMFYVFFFAIYKGTMILPLNDIFDSNTQSNLVIGFFIWFLFSATYSTLTNTVVYESSLGTFEQFFVSEFSIHLILIFKVYSRLIFELVLFFPLFFFLLFFYKINLFFNLLYFILVLILFPINIYIISIPIVSLSLIFKRVGALIQIYQYLLIVILLLPLEARVYNFIPFLSIVKFIKLIFVTSQVNFINIVSVFSTTMLGYLFVKVMLMNSVKYAKLKGTLGQY